MHEATRKRRALLWALTNCWVGQSWAQQAPPYSIDAATEEARLSIGARDVTWWTNTVQLGARLAPGSGWFVGAESQKRDRDTDVQANGGWYGKSGPWRWLGQASLAPGAAFLPRFGLLPQVGYVAGDYEVQAGLVYKSFAAARLRLATLGIVKYVGDSEYELHLAHGTSTPLSRRIQVATLRAQVDLGGPWSYGASASAGRGLYDILNVPGVSGNSGWSATLNARYRIGPAVSLRLDLGAGHENPDFHERRVGLSLRSAF